MKKINLGRVLPVFRGAYDGNEIYTKLDIVEFNGSSYVAKQTTTGVEPTDPDEGAENWIMVAQAGQATWEALTPQQKAAIYQDIINIVFGEYNDRLTLSHGGNTVSFFDDGNITTKKHNLDTMAQSIQTNANAINTKANANSVYTKQQINSTVSTLQDADTEIYNYAKDGFSNVDLDLKNMKDAVDGKADAATTYTTTQVDNKVSVVANAVSSLAGNVYTKAQINNTVNGINQNIETLQNTTYSRTYLNNALSGKANVENIYTKQQLDAMMVDKIVTPDYYADFATLIRNALYDIRESCGLDEFFHPIDNTTPVYNDTLTISIPTNAIQNKIYNCTQPLTSLTLESVGVSRFETVVFFESGSTATTFTYPSTLKWIGPDTIEANKSYVLSILYGRAALASETDTGTDTSTGTN